MREQFDGWNHSTHKAVATCNDCHTPHGNYVEKYIVKAVNGFNHSLAFTLDTYPEHLHIREFNAKIAEQNCKECHTTAVSAIEHFVSAEPLQSHAGKLRADDAIVAAREAGATDEELNTALQLHRAASMRWDFISSENSTGFHSPQESARVLADAIDMARQAELEAFKVLAAKQATAMGDQQLVSSQ